MGNEGRSGGPQGSKSTRSSEEPAEGQLLGNDRLQRDRHESQQQRRPEVVVVALVEEHRPGAGQQRSYGDSTHHHTGRGPAVPGTGPPMPAPEPDVVPRQTGMPTQYDEHDRAPGGTISVCSDPWAKYAATLVPVSTETTTATSAMGQSLVPGCGRSGIAIDRSPRRVRSVLRAEVADALRLAQ